MHWFFLSALVSITMYGGPWNNVGLNGTGPLKGRFFSIANTVATVESADAKRGLRGTRGDGELTLSYRRIFACSEGGPPKPRCCSRVNCTCPESHFSHWVEENGKRLKEKINQLSVATLAVLFSMWALPHASFFFFFHASFLIVALKPPTPSSVAETS